MTINKQKNGSTLTIAVQGRLDTTTAPDLEKEIKTSLDGVTELIMDFEKLDYISSAGLRVLLSAQKMMSKHRVYGHPDDRIRSTGKQCRRWSIPGGFFIIRFSFDEAYK